MSSSPTISPPWTELSFFVPGLPATQGSKVAFRHNVTGRIIQKDSCQRLPSWRARVGRHAARAMDGAPPLTGAVLLELGFFLPRPKSHFGTGRNAEKLKASAPKLPVVKPDLTKMVRAAEDAMAGICWKDDAQVCGQITSKEYTDPDMPIGVQITIRKLTDEDS